MTSNRKKANARHEQVVDQHACCVRGHRDNSRGNCGEQVCKDDEDEIAVWRCRLLVYKKYASGDRFSRVSVSYKYLKRRWFHGRNKKALASHELDKLIAERAM